MSKSKKAAGVIGRDGEGTLGRQNIHAIRRIMREQGVSQKDLAERLGCSSQNVSKLLGQKSKNLQLVTLERICDALDVEVSLQPKAPSSKEQMSDQAVAETEDRPTASNLESSGLQFLGDPIAVAKEIFDRLTRENPHALEELRRGKSLPRSQGRGRPKGSGQYDDCNSLARMADWIVSGECSSERRAARQIAVDHSEHSQKATAERLRRKYRESRESLETEAKMRLRQSQEPRSVDATAKRQRSSYGAGSWEDRGIPTLINSAVYDYGLDTEFGRFLRMETVWDAFSRLLDRSAGLAEISSSGSQLNELAQSIADRSGVLKSPLVRTKADELIELAMAPSDRIAALTKKGIVGDRIPTLEF